MHRTQDRAARNRPALAAQDVDALVVPEDRDGVGQRHRHVRHERVVPGAQRDVEAPDVGAAGRAVGVVAAEDHDVSGAVRAGARVSERRGNARHLLPSVGRRVVALDESRVGPLRSGSAPDGVQPPLGIAGHRKVQVRRQIVTIGDRTLGPLVRVIDLARGNIAIVGVDAAEDDDPVQSVESAAETKNRSLPIDGSGGGPRSVGEAEGGGVLIAPVDPRRPADDVQGSSHLNAHRMVLGARHGRQRRPPLRIHLGSEAHDNAGSCHTTDSAHR